MTKVGEFIVPKGHLKKMPKEWQDLSGKEIEYEVPAMQPAIGKAFTVCLIKVQDQVHTVPLSWIKDHYSTLEKGILKNKVYQHVGGHRIRNSGLGVGVQTAKDITEGSKSWACSMKPLKDFLSEYKFNPKDYTEVKG